MTRIPEELAELAATEARIEAWSRVLELEQLAGTHRDDVDLEYDPD